GVRFGAYHLFIPLLLKPGPRSLLAQYHAIASGTPQEKLANVLHLSASGRTSVPRDADLPDELYHAVGYRVCGAMAVRIDILERLADVIRPLIAWKPSDDADKPVPDGAAPGNAFTATVEMTSLVGCAGEDFASILKSLGYKSETVPAPTPEPQPVPEPQPQAETALETAPTPEVGATASSPEEPVEPNQAPAPEASSAFEGVDESEGETEPATITLWRPKSFKKQKTWQKKPQGDQRQHTRGPRKGGKPKSGGAPHGNPNKKGQRPQKRSTPRPERGPDPNSPFAALAALKDKMGDTPKD
ncbi:MAG: helicase, partial [Pseudomonadota bacterium]